MARKITCTKCGDAKLLNQYYIGSDGLYKQPCRECYRAKQRLYMPSPTTRDGMRARARALYKPKTDVRQLSEYLIAIKELEDCRNSLVFNRHSGGIPKKVSDCTDDSIANDTQAVKKAPISEYKFKPFGIYWEVGFFSTLGHWVTVGYYNTMGEAQRVVLDYYKKCVVW